MAGTFSQIYIQIVFAVKGRQNLVDKNWKDELYKYISGSITNKGHKSISPSGWCYHQPKQGETNIRVIGDNTNHKKKWIDE